MARKIRVLVVETYSTLRVALAELLFSWGYEAETASNGLEALGKIASFDPEVIISCLQMPHMGGMQLLEALCHRIPCIIISADAEPEDALEAIRLGAFSFLEKPAETERLHMDLQKCLDHRNTLRPGHEDRSPSESGVSPLLRSLRCPVSTDRLGSWSSGSW